MKKYELIRLRKLVNQEVERRRRINELLENELVIKYLKLTNTKINDLNSDNIKDILNQILNNFKITETNKIYVCTQAYYVDCRVSYQQDNWYTKDVDINSKYAENKTYKDIESGISIDAVNKENDSLKRPFITTFEKENIVLNPNNTNANKNGYDDVRIDFFENAYNYGQAKSKQKILSKYPRI